MSVAATMPHNSILICFVVRIPAARRSRSIARTSHATWMIEAGANPKDVQGEMRHSRISTIMHIYAQFVPESQRRALGKMSAMVAARTSKPIAVKTEKVAVEPQSRMVNYGNCSQLQPQAGNVAVQVIESMVARDGVEPLCGF